MPPVDPPAPALPAKVVDAYRLRAESVRLVPSLINLTYQALDQDDASLIVQRLHPVFAPEINWNILHVTQQLERAGVETPKLVPTRAGALWIETAEGTWRAQTFVAGVVLQRVPDTDVAFHAGKLVASFHRAVWDWPCEWQGQRDGVHDTARHLRKLSDALVTARAADDDDSVALGEALLGLARQTSSFETLPLRTCHGDLKISNLLFRGHGQGYPEGRCLIDLDTLGPLPLAHELGDALRSWCNDTSEDATRPEFRIDLFEGALEGYLSSAPRGLLAAELDSIAPGLITICLELATRFCVDVVEDCYFGWDATRFSSRREHNLARARNQLSLALAVQSELPRLQQLLARARRALDTSA